MAERIFRGGGARPPVPQMIAFIDDHRGVFGVGPICRVLGIAPSTYYAFKAVERDPDLASDRARQDQLDMAAIKQAFDSSRGRYGARKVWHQLRRSGHDIARCTVERLMKQIGIRGAVRGKAMKTTIPDTSAPCPRDKVNRTFRAPAPNLLWVSDFTYVSTTARQCIAEQCHERGGRALSMWPSSSIRSLIASSGGGSRGPPKRTLFSPIVHCCAIPCRAMDALEQALHDRRPVQKSGLVHHSDRGRQYLSIRYTERLAEAGIEPSVGSVGDSYDNALAETVNGLYKTELVHRQGPWRNMQDLEMATLGWVDWFNHRRLLGPIGNIPPAEAEQNFYAQRDVLDMVA